MERLSLDDVKGYIALVDFLDEAVKHSTHRIVNTRSRYNNLVGIGCVTCDTVVTSQTSKWLGAGAGFSSLENAFGDLGKYQFVKDLIKDFENLPYKDIGPAIAALSVKHADVIKRIKKLQLML